MTEQRRPCFLETVSGGHSWPDMAWRRRRADRAGHRSAGNPPPPPRLHILIMRLTMTKMNSDGSRHFGSGGGQVGEGGGEGLIHAGRQGCLFFIIEVLHARRWLQFRCSLRELTSLLYRHQVHLTILSGILSSVEKDTPAFQRGLIGRAT